MISKKYNTPEQNCKVVIIYDHLNRYTKPFNKIQCLFHSFKKQKVKGNLFILMKDILL
jgi:hypothetical protein